MNGFTLFVLGALAALLAFLAWKHISASVPPTTPVPVGPLATIRAVTPGILA